MKKFISSNYVAITLGILFIFALWSIISVSDGSGNFIFPNPVDTFKALGHLLTREYTYISILYTLGKTALGFVIALVLALILGSFAGIFKKSQPFFKPLIIVLKCVPTAAFVYLFLAKIGSSFAPMYIVILLAFPILYDSVVGGMNNIDNDILEAMRLDSKPHSIYPIFKVRIPLAMPYILIGMASSFALSLKTEIMAEIITGNTNEGLGSMISFYRNDNPTDLSPIFAIAVIAIILILIVSFFAYLIEKKVRKEI